MAEKNLGDLKAKFKVDVDQVTKLVKGVSDMRKDFATMETQLKKVNEQLNNIFKNLTKIKGVGGLSGSIGGGGTTPAGGHPLPLGDPKTQPLSVTNTQTYNAAPATLVYRDSGGGGGGGGGALASRMSRMATGGQLAGQAFAASIEMLNRRMDSNYDRSLGADKLGVYYQQNKGISQQNYVDTMRLPLANQRLGYGGISTMLAMQASTGLRADLNASGFAAQRALSGYSIGTDQLAQQAATLAGPAANNRMTMMLGTGMYGLGGKQKSSMQVMQDVIQRTGLTDPNRLKGARQLGSNTRAMLLASGVPEDMVDQYLDYAEANSNFQKKTGSKSMYDPSTLKDRKVMGIEDNFSTQAEETARTKEQRDENFYDKQKGNLAQFEKNIQGVTKALGKLEDKLSDIVGLNIKTRGGMGRKIAGYGLMAAGAATTLATFGGATPLGLGMMAAGGAMLGDPEKSVKAPAGKGGSILYGYSKPPERKSIGEVQNTAGFRNLNATFRDRLLRMFEANPAVGLGSGHRSEAEQERLFLSRYSEVTDGSKGDATYKGKQYKRHSGAAVAPPGRSMHEVGLAADLVGDLDWVAKHAHEFGLKTIDGLNEPWHIQPAELPDSRYEWEKQGSKMGHPSDASKGEVATDPSTGGPEGVNVVGDKIVKGSSLVGAVETFNQPSIASIVGAGSQYDAMDGGGTSNVVSKAALNENPSSTPTSKGSGVSGTMDPVEMAQIMLRRKFPKESIAKMLAISYRESRWQPGARKNDDVEDSFGLFQINMKGNLGPVRRGHYGLSSNEELFDPIMNIKAARILFGDGQGIKHWAIDGDPMHNTAEGMPKAIAAAQAVGIDSIGDPTFSEPTRGGGNVTVGGATTVTIAPNIYITSSGSTASDAQQMALELARLLDNNLKRELLRSM